MITRVMKHCCKCKRTLDECVLMISSKCRNSVSYVCRPCNTLRLQEYRKTKRGKERTRIAVAKSMHKFYYKQLARSRLNEALKRGLVTKPAQCQCGSLKVEAHHENYEMPLLVKWLCRACHADIHRVLEERLIEVD